MEMTVLNKNDSEKETFKLWQIWNWKNCNGPTLKRTILKTNNAEKDKSKKTNLERGKLQKDSSGKEETEKGLAWKRTTEQGQIWKGQT